MTSEPDPTVEPAGGSERPAIERLLIRCGLPTEGLSDCGGELFVVRADGRVVGCAGLDVRGSAALLRSVAVDPDHRGRRLGERLTAAALDRATGLGLDAVYLLTTTAERFFPRFGFETIARDVVPPAIRGSVEFTSACPASAVVMRRPGPSAPAA